MRSCCRRGVPVVLIAGAAMLVGCQRNGGDVQRSVTKQAAPPGAGGEQLLLSRKIYSVSNRQWEAQPTLEDPDFSTIKQKLETAVWDDGSAGPRFLLIRTIGGKRHQIGVKQSQSQTGKLEVGVVMQLDGEWFEATDYQLDSIDTVVRLFQAFYQHDAAIKTMIQWDEIVE